MNNAQLYLAVGLPVFAITASLVISLLQISGIRDEMKAIRQEMIGLRTEFNAQIQGIREDIKLIMSKLADLETRVSIIEERIK